MQLRKASSALLAKAVYPTWLGYSRNEVLCALIADCYHPYSLYENYRVQKKKLKSGAWDSAEAT